MKKLFALFLALTLTAQLAVPAWAETVPGETAEVTEATEILEEPEEKTTEETEEEIPEESTEETEEGLPEETTEETEATEPTQEETVEEAPAAFQEAESQVYAVKFDPDGGTIWGEASGTYTPGEVIALPEAQKRGYRFLGWYEAGQVYTEISADSTGDRYFTAQWEEKKTLNIDMAQQVQYYDGNEHSYSLKTNLDENWTCHSNWIFPCVFWSACYSSDRNTIELETEENSLVCAIRPGVVVSVTYSTANRYEVTINHGDGYVSEYKELSSVCVSAGQKLAIGEKIGNVGHGQLCLGLLYSGTYTDPMEYLPYTSDCFYVSYAPGSKLNAFGWPVAPGTYDVHIMRQETEEYKAVDVYIPSALVIKDIPHGRFDEGGTWVLEDGVLTIDGNVRIYPTSENAPWAEYGADITELVINASGDIGMYAFENLENLQRVTFAYLYGIDAYAFSGCTSLRTITFTKNIPYSISDTAFNGVQAEAHYTVNEDNNNVFSSDDKLKDYGGSLTWVEHGADAKMLIFSNVYQDVAEYPVGEEITLKIEASPADATADCTYSVDKEGILELQKASFRKCTFLAIAPGEATVTATDKRTGATASCKIRIHSNTEKQIECPYQEVYFVENEESFKVHRYRFTPKKSGYYVSIMEGFRGTEYYDGFEWRVEENGEYVQGIYYASDDGVAEVVYYLVSGKEYSIYVDCHTWQEGESGTFRWISASDQVTGISFQEEEGIYDIQDVSEGTSSHGGASVRIEPIGAYAPIQWVSNDPYILKIMESYSSSCEFELKQPGRTVLTAICGNKTASMSVIGRSSVKLTENKELTLLGDTYDEMRYVTFQPSESGKYAFTVKGIRYDVLLFGGTKKRTIYGLNEVTTIAEFREGETASLRTSINKGKTATVAVQKVTDIPQKLELVCSDNRKDNVRIEACFTPVNSYDKIVKWEINTPDVLGKKYYPGTGNSLILRPYKKGEATITATSESGLTASITLTVGQCFESHNYEVAEVVSPTCTVGGYTRSVCQGCDRELIEDRIPALGHNLVLTEAKAPTYAEEGNNAYYVCVRCCKVYRDAEGTVETTVATETLPRLEGPELDRSPRLGAAYVTLNSNLLDGVSTGLVESYGNTILSVAVYEYDKAIKGYSAQESTRFEAEAGDGTLTLFCRETLKNGTYPLRLEVICSIGSYSYDLSVKVTNTLPKPTVKQAAKLNLFYKNSTAPLAVTVPGQTIENVELTDTEDFALEPSENGWEIVYMTENLKPDTKGTLNIYLEGYREPVKVALTVGTVSTAPTIKLSAASSTINSAFDLTTRITLLDKSGKPLELENPSVDCDNADVSIDGNLVTITLDAAKTTTVTMYLRDSDWAKSVKLTHKVTVSNKKPTLKPAGNLTLSSLFTARTAETAMVLSQSNLSLNDVDFVSTAKEGSAAWTEAQKLELVYDGGYVTAKIVDADNAPKAGTYSFKCTGTLETEETIPGGTLKVTVSAVAPKVKLSATSVKLNQFLAGEEQGTVTVTAPNGYQVVDFAGMPKGMTFDEETGILAVMLQNNAGAYTLYPVVQDVETGEEVELSTKLSFKVQAYNSQKLGVTLSAKGKLDTQTDGEITYTVTKLTNCLGTVEGMDPMGQDAELFQTSIDYVNGKATVHLTLKDGETYATNRSYKVQFKFYACGQNVLSPVQTVKVTQTALKVTAPKTVTYYQAQKSPLRVVLTTNVPLDEVVLNSKTAKEFREAVGNVTLDGNRLEFEITNPGAMKAGKSYVVVLDATPCNNASNVNPVTVKLTVKVQK